MKGSVGIRALEDSLLKGSTSGNLRHMDPFRPAQTGCYRSSRNVGFVEYHDGPDPFCGSSGTKSRLFFMQMASCVTTRMRINMQKRKNATAEKYIHAFPTNYNIHEYMIGPLVPPKLE